MDLHKTISQIKTKNDFSDFIANLVRDLKENPKSWENNNLERFLYAMKAWVEDMEGYYINQKKKMPDNINWEVFANILLASKMYE